VEGDRRWGARLTVPAAITSETAVTRSLSMTRILYELHGRDQYRFSPYCWRTIMALHHKGLEFERIPMKLTDRACIAPSGQDRVPVLVDDKTWINDSWAIACYLEETYGDAPSLFGGAAGQRLAEFVNRWADHTDHGALRAIAVPDAWRHIDPDDREWFRQSREKMFGRPLETLRAERDGALPAFRDALEPARAVLAAQPYLSGKAPAYADYILLGTFMWPRCSSPYPLLDADDPVHHWRGRMLTLFDAAAANAPGYDV